MQKPANTSEQDSVEQKAKTCCRDPIDGIVFGLIVIWLGVVLFLENRDILAWDVSWLWYFLFGLGVIILLEVVVRYAVPTYRQRMGGRLIIAVGLVAVGAWQITGLGDWWPLILIVAGVIIIVSGLKSREESRP